MEAELVRELPEPDGWQYEPKWDGFSGILENTSGELRLWSRNARPLLRYFPELRPLGKLLPARSALDGEIVIERGRHPRLRRDADPPASGGVADQQARGRDPRPLHRLRRPRLERRRSLARVVHRAPKELERKAKRFDLSPASRDRDEALAWLDRFEAIGLDGVVAKRIDLAYLPGSREGVVKVKPEKTADCVVVGLRWKSRPDRIATLLLGLYDEKGEIDYVGSAAVAPAQHAQIAERVLPLLENAPSDVLGAEPLGRRRARGIAGATGARGRGALRQGAVEPLPPRHEAHPLPRRQGSGAMHLARAAPARGRAA